MHSDNNDCKQGLEPSCHLHCFYHNTVCGKVFLSIKCLRCGPRYLWGVGTLPGKDDIVTYHNLTRYDKSSCLPTVLHHNTTYYSTVIAYNNALNSKPTNSSSDGGFYNKTDLNYPTLPTFEHQYFDKRIFHILNEFIEYKVDSPAIFLYVNAYTVTANSVG